MSSSSRAVRIVVVSALLLLIVMLGRQKAYELYSVYREFTALEKQLPDLPQVHVDAQRRRTEFPVKLWLHRVDSIERAVLMAKAWKGMEIDVVYDSAGDYFDVGHPPTPSQGISLDQIFASLPDITGHYFWIDFKNLTAANQEPACRRLGFLGRKYGIVKNIIVESPNPRALSCFTDVGFYTSYYLFASADVHTIDRQQLARYYAEVRSNLLGSRVNALSSDRRFLPFINKYFPNPDILLWSLERNPRLRYYASLAYLTLNRRIKVILVNQESPGYR
jgi:hypothetical protein